ncbi:unnamed protein product [Lepeophtheirus salmonis]|uniref:(salmon louse) hypothetical protein n=1 Tax=Lepeophtheirus salmonis TaxID=72036 RepID=A0A7R8CZS2_LEPSM|nr:unnamed protein product [Lepeophtheirus salmonis]CAF2978506.1 unnamed protein product [Lepeophtheirus salmonis]
MCFEEFFLKCHQDVINSRLKLSAMPLELGTPSLGSLTEILPYLNLNVDQGLPDENLAKFLLLRCEGAQRIKIQWSANLFGYCKGCEDGTWIWLSRSSRAMEGSCLTYFNNKLEIRYTPDKGRSIFAKRDLGIGTIVSSERPLVAFIHSKHSAYSHCVHCFRTTFNPLPCPSCNHSVFCSLECLRKKKSHHYYECQMGLDGIIAKLCPKTPEPELMDESYDRLWHKIRIFTNDTTNYFEDALPSDFENVYRTMQHYEAILDGNSFTLEEFYDRKRILGSALYDYSSFYNHSCDPNACFIFDSAKRIRVIVTSPVLEGEEITISYGPLVWNQRYEERLNKLKNYNFICRCIACKNKISPGEENDPHFKINELQDQPEVVLEKIAKGEYGDRAHSAGARGETRGPAFAQLLHFALDRRGEFFVICTNKKNSKIEIVKSYLVHSKDLFEHIAQEVGECLESGLYTDLIIRCKEGQTLHAHRLVLSAISPYFKMLLLNQDANVGDINSIELPDIDFIQVQRLLEVVYNGSVEATMDEINIIELLDLKLPELRPLPSTKRDSQELENSSDAKIKKLESPGEREYICPICNSTYTNFGNFGQHMKRHDNEELFQHVVEERMARINEMITSCFDPITSQYICEICKSTYSHPGNFKQHLLKHEREANGLGKNKNRNSMQGSNNHGDRNLDANIKMYECEQCGRVFKHPGNFKQHMSSHFRAAAAAAATSAISSFKKVKLPDLPKIPVPQSSISGVSPSPAPPKSILNSRSHFLNPRPHFLNSSGQVLDPPPCSVMTRWRCNHCPQPTFFQSREKLRQHVAANHRGPNANHARKHTPLPANLIPSVPLSPPSITANYKECEICHQLFDTESQLSQHMSTHVTIKEEPTNSLSSELTYHCDEPGCTQAFSKEIWVRKHKETFHEISPEKLNGSEGGFFECRIYMMLRKIIIDTLVTFVEKKRFTRPQHVNRHKLLHTGERIHKCKDCNASFAREDKLNYHIMNECEYSVVNMENIEYELDDGELMAEETITS